MTDGADVAVVGGGVIGCACAFQLARLGAEVVLVERAELAAGASGRNHGLLLAPLDPVLMPMADASTKLYEEVAQQSPLPIHLDPERRGFLIVAPDDPEERRAAAAEATAAAGCGIRTERLEGVALRAFEPGIGPDLVEGWYLDDGRRLDPAALTVGLALLARDLGADIRHHLMARSILCEGSAVRGVATDEGKIDADAVVVAAGPWSTSLLRPLGVHLAVTGARGWLVHLGPAAGLTGRLIEWAGWHAIPGHDTPPPIRAADLAEGRGGPVLGSLVQPNPDGTVLVGGSRQNALTNEPEHPDVPRQILRRAIRILPALGESEVLSAWWGVRPTSPDGRPVIGVVGDGLLVATGHGSQGVILGGGTAQLVASMVDGGSPPFDPQPFAPGRFESPGPP